MVEIWGNERLSGEEETPQRRLEKPRDGIRGTKSNWPAFSGTQEWAGVRTRKRAENGYGGRGRGPRWEHALEDLGKTVTRQNWPTWSEAWKGEIGAIKGGRGR